MGEFEIAGNFVVGQNAKMSGPITSVDGYGDLTAVEIHGESIHEVLSGEPLEQLKKLAAEASQRKELRSGVSRAYVQRHLVRWVEQTRLGQTTASWTEELEAAVARDVRELRVLVPCDGIEIARRFQLGNVEFGFFTRDDILRMTEPFDPANPRDVRWRQNMMDAYLGRVYAVHNCTAEERCAEDRAIAETEAALDVLRFLDGAAMDPRVLCFIGRYGQVREGTMRVFFGRPDDNVPRLTERTERSPTWRSLITEEFLDDIVAKPIAAATRILTASSPTELEQLALDAVRRFAHGVTSPAVQDRLLNAFTAVESLLLANENEAIVDRLGLRMAFVNGTNPQDRRQLLEDLRAGYGIRSRFIHHGRIPGDLAQVTRTLAACWRTVFLILLSTDTYRTKAEMLRALDDRILA